MEFLGIVSDLGVGLMFIALIILLAAAALFVFSSYQTFARGEQESGQPRFETGPQASEQRPFDYQRSGDFIWSEKNEDEVSSHYYPPETTCPTEPATKQSSSWPLLAAAIVGASAVLGALAYFRQK